MSISPEKQPRPEAPIPIKEPLSLRGLSELLVRHYDIHEGRYDLLVEFQIGVGAVGPSPDFAMPGAMIGISKVGLTPSKSEVNGPTTVDAALVNPKNKPRRTTKK